MCTYCCRACCLDGDTYSAVPEIVSVCEITSVLWVALLLQWQVEVSLTDVILPINLFLGEASTSDAEETCVVHLRARQDIGSLYNVC